MAGDGTLRQISVAQAVQAGLASVDEQGRVHHTLAGRRAQLRVVNRQVAVLPHEAAAEPPVPTGAAAPGASPAPGTAPTAATLPVAKPQPPSAMLGTLASGMFLARGLLQIAQGPGLPTWQTAYFTANGINRFTGKKFLPEWLQKGPVKMGIDLLVVGQVLQGSAKAWPGTMRALHGNIAAARAAANGAQLGIGQLVKAAFKPNAGAASAAAGAAHVATRGAKANVPFLSKLFPLIAPLAKYGFSVMALGSLLAFPEYLREHGTKGLISTKTGRGALFGAISGAAMLGAIWLPASPGQGIVDTVANVMWLTELVNGNGWLDGLLGGDKPEAPKPAATTAPLAPAMPPASGMTQAAAAAGTLARFALAPGLPTFPTVPAAPATAATASPRARRRRSLHRH